MTTPKYLETFRRAAREAGTREKSELSEKRGTESGLISLNTLISPPGALQNPSESDATVCAVCGAADNLWHLDTPSGPIAVHPECAEFLPKPEPVEPTAAYYGVTAEPDGSACRVTIVELPSVGLRYRRTFVHLQLKPPAYVPEDRWQQCIEDGRAFLHQWGETAQRLGWDSRDLFGLHTPPERPHPSYSRLSRYDATGLVWLLQGRKVIALTADTATIKNPTTGTITTYRKHRKPALGPVGDSLEDLQ